MVHQPLKQIQNPKDSTENDVIRRRMMALANMQAKTINKNNLQNQYINKENKFIK
jgi:hypothetical protein